MATPNAPIRSVSSSKRCCLIHGPSTREQFERGGVCKKDPIYRATSERRSNLFKEFKDFAMRGNVVDMAVGIIVGGAFGTIAKSLVSDVLMPPIGLILGGVDFSNLFVVLQQGATPGPYVALSDARAAGAVTINYGMFLNNVISFLIVAFAAFLLIRGINSLQRKEEAAPPKATEKECQYCLSKIASAATRCPHCTSDVSAA